MPLFNPASTASAIALIEQRVSTGSSGTITFSSIPQTYRHLRLVTSARCEVAAASGSINITLNNDSGANYARQRTEQTGSSVTTQTLTSLNNLNVSVVGSTAPAGKSATMDLLIPDYVGGFHKVMCLNLTAATTAGTFIINTTAGWWLNTAAVTRLDLVTASGNFTSGSVFSLYGLT